MLYKARIKYLSERSTTSGRQIIIGGDQQRHLMMHLMLKLLKKLKYLKELLLYCGETKFSMVCI